MISQIKIISIISLVAFYSNNLLFAADHSWPQNEIGAAESGFSEEGIEQLDLAMREIVANQDVAGMIWMLAKDGDIATCLLYTSPSPRDLSTSRMPSSA